MNQFIYFFFFFFLLTSCGVKAPPIAPERKNPPSTSKENDCTPHDVDCNVEDANYVKQKK